MLRHLGPVFPVSGSRHQTSWPGSDKTDRQFWRHFLKSHQAASSSEISLILCHFFSVFFYFEIRCINVSLKTSQRVLFLAENNKARLAAAVPVKMITGWQPGWKISCAAQYFAVRVCVWWNVNSSSCLVLLNCLTVIYIKSWEINTCSPQHVVQYIPAGLP